MSRVVLVPIKWGYGQDELLALELEPEDETVAPWWEKCDGCNGTGHLGFRVEPRYGPCESCWGHGKVLFAFHVGSIQASCVPAAVAVTTL